MLGPAVHRGKDTTHKTLESTCNARAWPRGCNKLCDKRNKRNVWSCWLKRLTDFKLCATIPNMQQGVLTDATGNIDQSRELLANNDVSVCTGP